MTPGAGIIGPTTEHFEYDGLSRITQATSGLVAVDREYDSLSILRSETSSLGGRTIEVLPDEVIRAFELLLPSSYTLRQEYDALGQLEQVQEVTGPSGSETFSPLAGFDYQGPGIRSEKQAGGLSASRVFDAARRPTGESATTSLGLESFGEQTRWTPRGLKSARSRTDLNGSGQLYAYDTAGRLSRQALVGSLGGVANNEPLSAASLEQNPHYDFQVDPADNLVQRVFEDSARVEGITTPRDGSGRNRPGSINGVALTYDANGNLTQKGDLAYEYDYRNRLTRISDAGGEIVTYTYDAFDRRVQKELPALSLVEQTVWSGWRPVELYRNGQLAERRVYGAGLDEIVALQQDTDGDGLLDATRVPWYDSTGNLVVLTRPDGSILERYDYTPMGEAEVRVDLDPPVVERVVVGPTKLELILSEEASHDRVGESVENDDVQLIDDSTGSEIEIDLSGLDLESSLFSVPGSSTSMTQDSELAAVTAGQTVSAASRRTALRRRLLFTVTDPPAAGTQVTFSVASAAIVDSFHNPLSAPYTVSFAWPASDTVVADSAPPRVEEVHLADGHLEVSFSEDPDAATVASALDVGDPSVSWTASPDGFTYRSDQSFTPGTYSLTIDTTLLDRAGQALAAPLVLPFELEAGTLKLVLYEAPDPTLVSDSTVGNLFGFHGLPRDPESGLYYARHRYYDPELGRFITPDPMGYADGPNAYQYALNDPVNRTDPMGLFSLDVALMGVDLALDVGRDPAFAWDVAWGTAEGLGRQFMVMGQAQGFNSGLQSGLETFAATGDSGLTLGQRLRMASKFALRSQMTTQTHGFSEARTVEDFHAIVGEIAGGLTGWDQFSLGVADLQAGRRSEGNLRMIAGTGALASTIAGTLSSVAAFRGGTVALSGRPTARRRLWSRASSQPSSLSASLSAARHPVYDQFEAAVRRNRGRFLENQNAMFPNRRLARQAASEIAGNLGSKPSEASPQTA